MSEDVVALSSDLMMHTINKFGMTWHRKIAFSTGTKCSEPVWLLRSGSTDTDTTSPPTCCVVRLPISRRCTLRTQRWDLSGAVWFSSVSMKRVLPNCSRWVVEMRNFAYLLVGMEFSKLKFLPKAKYIKMKDKGFDENSGKVPHQVFC